MGRSGTARFLKSVFRVETLKNLLIYILVPFLCLGFLAQPIGNAVRGSAAAAFLIPAAALGLVALNWYIHTVVRRERPTLLVYAHGVFCVLVTAAIAYAALPGYTEQASTLAVIVGCLTLVSLFLFSFHLASRRSRPAHAFAVLLWLVIGTIAFFMAYRIFEDVRIRRVNQDTWITALVLLALIPVPFARRIRYAVRLAAAQRSASCPAAGRITQVVGETFLDRDGDPFTHYAARIRRLLYLSSCSGISWTAFRMRPTPKSPDPPCGNTAERPLSGRRSTSATIRTIQRTRSPGGSTGNSLTFRGEARHNAGRGAARQGAFCTEQIQPRGGKYGIIISNKRGGECSYAGDCLAPSV